MTMRATEQNMTLSVDEEKTMKRVFGRGDWAANGVLFAAYHVHMPWLMPGTLLFDTFAMAYPSRRFQSTWIGIIVHGSQSVFFGAILLTYVL